MNNNRKVSIRVDIIVYAIIGVVVILALAPLAGGPKETDVIIALLGFTSTTLAAYVFGRRLNGKK